MQQRRLRVDFVDFWPGFDKVDNWIASTLSRRFDIEICTQPDIVIYSCYGSQWQSYDCTRVLVSWENRGWGFSQCDWAFTSDYNDHERHSRLPLWVAWLEQPFQQPALDATQALSAKEGFASIVVSNGASPTRNRFHDALDEYLPVSSGGRFRNNVGGPVPDKGAFIARYKFNLAFENSSFPGYTTEKLLHALQADTVPIYWGDPLVARDFNPRRFVNVHDFESPAALRDHVAHLDQNDALYCEILGEPWFRDGSLPACADLEAFLDRFEEIAEWRGTRVAQRGRLSGAPARVRDRVAIRRRYRQRQS
jgi:hypothetical protein